MTRRLMPRPEPAAALLGGEERLAEARHHVGRHAGAAIEHADHGAALVVLVDDDVDLAARRRRLRRVAHQVDHHLRDLAAVDDAERPLLELEVHAARLDVAVEAQDASRLLDGGGDVARLAHVAARRRRARSP